MTGPISASGPVDRPPSAQSTASEPPTQPRLPGTPVAATGDSRVDEVISSLEGLEGMSAEDQADVIERVHDRLRQTLNDLDGASTPAPPADAATSPADQDSTD